MKNLRYGIQVCVVLVYTHQFGYDVSTMGSVLYSFIQHNFFISYDFIIPRRVSLGTKKDLHLLKS